MSDLALCQQNTEQEDLRTQACTACGHPGAETFLEGPDRFHHGAGIYQLVRCPTCSLVWIKNPPAPNEMGRHYSDNYYNVLEQGAEADAGRWRWHRDLLLKFKRQGSLLDLGCSSGSFLASVQEHFAPLYGIEMSAEAARRAEERTGAEVFTGDVLDAPFAAGSFDAITAFDVLEHMYKPREVVQRAWKWLKPGGVFYVSLPNIGSWEAKMLRSYWYGLELPRHLCHFSPTSLRRLFFAAGFREVWLGTPPATYLGYSAGYIVDDVRSRLGLPRAGGRRPFLWRALRKMNRMTLLFLIGRIAAACGCGPNLEAMFKKPEHYTSAHK